MAGWAAVSWDSHPILRRRGREHGSLMQWPGPVGYPSMKSLELNIYVLEPMMKTYPEFKAACIKTIENEAGPLLEKKKMFERMLSLKMIL